MKPCSLPSVSILSAMSRGAGDVVHAADVAVEQVRDVVALAADLGVEVEAAGGEPTGRDDARDHQ
jgi:plasmid stability protein